MEYYYSFEKIYSSSHKRNENWTKIFKTEEELNSYLNSETFRKYAIQSPRSGLYDSGAYVKISRIKGGINNDTKV